MESFEKEFAKIEARYNTGEHLRKTEELKKRLESHPVVLYGVGFFGAVIFRNFINNDIPVVCFCDSYKTGVDTETQLDIITPQQLQSDFADSNIVVSVANPKTHKQVYEYILSLGFSDEQVFGFDSAYKFFNSSRVEVVKLTFEEMRQHFDGYKWAYNFFPDGISKKIILKRINGYLFNDCIEYDPDESWYFPEILKVSDKEVFVDAGLYIGDTSEDFIKKTNGKYQQIFGFEIDGDNYEKAADNLADYKNIYLIKKGLWSKVGQMRAATGNLAGSSICDDGSEIVELVSLDEFFSAYPENEHPTFIKMDIEGAEKEALRGGEKIIRRAHPKLAICAYHKPEDIYELPQLIHSYNPNYKFALKHYSPFCWETVLYAY